jgi:hypothetical protein
MSHRHGHHKKSAVADSAMAERDVRRRELQSKAAMASKLPEDDPRIEALGWLLLSLDNVKAAILRGSPVQIEPWQRLVDAMTGLCPKVDMLRVAFLYKCHICKAETEVDRDTLCAKCKAELPPKPIAAVADASAVPAASAVEPASAREADVVPLAKPKPAPKRSRRPDDYVSPHVDHGGQPATPPALCSLNMV